ncbi:MAG: hypothetical protein ACI8W7_004895 [Gammaproteobacteria bacterium]
MFTILFNDNLSILDAHDVTRYASSAFQRHRKTRPNFVANEALIMLQAKQRAIVAWRRHFQAVLAVYRIFHIKHATDLTANTRAIFNRDALRLGIVSAIAFTCPAIGRHTVRCAILQAINIQTQYRVLTASRNLHSEQFAPHRFDARRQQVIESSLFDRHLSLKQKVGYQAHFDLLPQHTRHP